MRKLILLLVVFLLYSADVDAQCAMCRAVLESEETQSAARGINNGIVYLMAIPYILMGGLGYVIYRSRRKRQEAKN
ncbi:hypothetical protein [Gilvibacter sp.]|uniref:hypothetical protein n=1 Tax=Gilvibacter sp. TaxID=2729997 RepID=UPI003F4A6F56